MTRRASGRGIAVSIGMLAGGAASFLVAGALAAGPATAANGGGPSAAPPGANATIKINNIPFGGGVNNEPHVTCPFQLSLYNFDHGAGVENSATVVFVAQPPSGHGIVLAPAEGASSFTFPGPGFADTYSFDTATLQPLFLQPNQGYHVKVSVSVTSTGIKDTGKKTTHSKVTKKFKVFWLTCAAASPSPTPTVTETVSPTPTVTATASVTPTESPSSPGASVLPTETSRAPSPGTTVLGKKVVRPPSSLPFTGMPASTKVLLPLALGCVLTGAGLIGLARRMRVGAHR
jgi:hypothetical protein